jgi:hypothetical protein
MRFIFLLFALILITLPVSAQQKYSTWSNPDNTGTPTADSTKEIVDKLNALIDEAEKSRAADPIFLRDLRDLARSYSAPQQTSLLVDDFRDGDFATNPVWKVSEGKYWIEKDWGLRSAVTLQAESAPQPEKKADSKDLAFAILGAVLKQATKNSGGSTTTTPAEPQLAAIHSTVAISNAFSVAFEFSSWQPKGRLDIGPYQGTDTSSGYRLSYTPGGTITLLRTSSRGTNVVKQVTGATPLEDQKTHTVLWTRDTSGQMNVAIDGKTVLNVADRGFSDPFQGVTIANRGGDYIIKKIAISGTR